jgi:hypothetical protein
MTSIEALHTAARRYCEGHAIEWEQTYGELLASEKLERDRRGIPEPVSYTYSPDALGTFPRYHVLHAILFEVERFKPDDFTSIEEARSLIAAAGETAESVFTRPPNGDLEQRAMDEERQRFSEYVLSLSGRDLELVEPLPFRRTLSAGESDQAWSELKRRWGIDGYWYPLDRRDDAAPPPDTSAFDAQPFFEAEVQDRLRTIIESLGTSRVLEIREHDADGPDRELDVELLEPVYTGAEGFWTDKSFAWVIYASHEGSVTVAGAGVLAPLREAFPQSDDWAYRAWR